MCLAPEPTPEEEPQEKKKKKKEQDAYLLCLPYIANEMTYVNFVIRPAPVGVGIGKMEILILPIE